MSRIGKMPVPVPKGVTVTISDEITVKGPKGQLQRPIVDGVSVRHEDGTIFVNRDSDVKKHRAAHGLMRALIANMVTGVTSGFEKKLEIQGVGYKAENKGNSVVFNLGYSHPINFDPPAGIQVKVEKNLITVSGVDKEAVGQTAAVIRGFRSPDSYKGKGIRYVGEYVRLKPGKSAKS
jgi:large subunit ribosomal protein L6